MKMENYIAWMKSTYYISIVGNPAISMPCAFSGSGLPIGIQIVGRHNDDWGVLQLGYAFEQATNIGERHPGIVQRASSMYFDRETAGALRPISVQCPIAILRPGRVARSEEERMAGTGAISAQAHDGRHPGGGGTAEELGTMGRERRNWHAQLHAARRTSSRRPSSCAKAKSCRWRSLRPPRPAGRKDQISPLGRFNPVHLMMRTGTDAYSGVLDSRKIRSADDVIIMPMQCGTQWDGLGHIFYGDHMWNGYDCRTVTSAGAQKCGIEKTSEKMVGRGVLLDIPADARPWNTCPMDSRSRTKCSNKRRAPFRR